MSGVGVDAGGFAGVASGLGFTGGGVPVDLAGVGGGPFITGVVVDGNGDTIAVVAVSDTPNTNTGAGGVDGLLGELMTGAGIEAGGVTQAAGPVATASELAARFSMPVIATVFTGPGDTTLVYMTASDRRTQDTSPDPGGSTAAGRPPTAVTQPKTGTGAGGLDKLINVALEVSVELGRTRVTLSEVLDYDVGSIIELDRAAGAPVDVRVNDTLLAQGEVVLIDDEYAVRITAIIETQT